MENLFSGLTSETEGNKTGFDTAGDSGSRYCFVHTLLVGTPLRLCQ